MDKKKNLEGHLKTIQDDIDKVTAEFTDQENLPVKTLQELYLKYSKLVDCGQFIASMINGMFPCPDRCSEAKQTSVNQLKNCALCITHKKKLLSKK